MAFRAVLFDIGDTLWHAADAPPPAKFRRLAAERAKAFLASISMPVKDPALVARVAWDSLEGAMREARRTDRREPDYAAIARDALRARGVELSLEYAAALMEAIYVSGPEGGKAAYPGARELLDTLRSRGFKLGIITNRAFGGERFRDDLKAAGLDIGWDANVVSVEVGYLKPHPAIFERALSDLGETGTRTVMVGNSLAEDIAGAQAFGMATAWKRSKPDAEGVTPDFTFDDVSELLDWSVLKGVSVG
ncbi:MAG TPA: HAD family hydrolase [Tepidiformaceae bacterium]|nr:HAD family hydrolase [Tepidiformaceae bacterium]